MIPFRHLYIINLIPTRKDTQKAYSLYKVVPQKKKKKTCKKHHARQTTLTPHPIHLSQKFTLKIPNVVSLA